MNNECLDLFSDNAIWATLAGCTLLLWPVIGPYIEIAWLAGKTSSKKTIFESVFMVAKSAEEIEDAVEVKEPIQSNLDTTLKLFGEDALLDWPGAMDPVVHQRDKYMTRNIYKTSIGKTDFIGPLLLHLGEGNGAPAYVPDVHKDQIVCRLFMPEDGPRQSAPMGTGDGAYIPLNGNTPRNDSYPKRRIVAIVGTAHVRGMCKEWEKLKGGESEASFYEFLSS